MLVLACGWVVVTTGEKGEKGGRTPRRNNSKMGFSLLFMMNFARALVCVSVVLFYISIGNRLTHIIVDIDIQLGE